MLAAIAINTFGLGLCLYAYSRPWDHWDQHGPLLLLRGSSIVLGIALLCTLAALLLDFPDARGVVVVLAFVVIGIAIWRQRSQPRRRPWTNHTVTPSVTIREIENMEVQQ